MSCHIYIYIIYVSTFFNILAQDTPPIRTLTVRKVSECFCKMYLGDMTLNGCCFSNACLPKNNPKKTILRHLKFIPSQKEHHGNMNTFTVTQWFRASLTGLFSHVTWDANYTQRMCCKSVVYTVQRALHTHDTKKVIYSQMQSFRLIPSHSIVTYTMHPNCTPVLYIHVNTQLNKIIYIYTLALTSALSDLSAKNENVHPIASEPRKWKRSMMETRSPVNQPFLHQEILKRKPL